MTDSPSPECTERGDTGCVVRLRALETVIRLEAPTPDAATQLRREWSRCLVETPDPTEVPLPVAARDTSPDRWGYALASQVTRVAIEAAAGRYLMFHAAAVVDREGRALVLVAPSGTGKTTAAVELGRASLGYLTDEAVAIDDGGRVLPYPKPLSVVRTGGGKAQHGPDELGLGEAPADSRVRRLVLLDRTAGNEPPRLERIPLLDALVAVIPQTSALPSLVRPLQRLCELADRCGGIYRLTYREITGAARALGALLAEPSRPSETWSALVPPAGERAASSPTNALRRAECLDAVRVGDEALLLVASRPIRLSPVGLSVWLAADGATLPDLVDAAVRDHGPDPDALPIVRDAVDAMLATGVLASE